MNRPSGMLSCTIVSSSVLVVLQKLPEWFWCDWVTVRTTMYWRTESYHFPKRFWLFSEGMPFHNRIWIGWGSVWHFFPFQTLHFWKRKNNMNGQKQYYVGRFSHLQKNRKSHPIHSKFNKKLKIWISTIVIFIPSVHVDTLSQKWSVWKRKKCHTDPRPVHIGLVAQIDSILEQITIGKTSKNSPCRRMTTFRIWVVVGHHRAPRWLIRQIVQLKQSVSCSCHS